MKEMEALCYPRSICLIGASGKEGKVGNIILQNLSGWQGPLYLVHPREREIQGKKVHADLTEIPDDLDLGIIASRRIRPLRPRPHAPQRASRS